MSTPSLPEEQNALLITAKGARMTVGKRLVPKPGAGQVIVNNIAVAINPVDVYIQKFGLFVKDEDLPAVCGNDASGEVCALGEDVQGWSIGDKVLYNCHMANDRYTFQEYTLVDAARMALVPSSITFEQAATIPLCLGVASIGIYERKDDALRPDGFDRGGAGLTPPWAPGGSGKYAGQAALVVGGASSVGQFALQLLKASGFSPLITTASSHNEEYCKAAGATHVVDYNVTPYERLPGAVKSIVGDTPVGFVFDAVAHGGIQIPAFSILAPGGGMVTVVPPEVGKRAEDDEQGRRVVWVFGGVNEEEHKEFGKELYGRLTGMIEDGVIKPNRVRVLDGGLGAIPSGCDELEKGVSGIKLVVRVRD
ncbi:GroES-like protein [Peniophora sp. CONT]|nr:GroES-like protein [Peniophora sp. CONT]